MTEIRLVMRGTDNRARSTKDGIKEDVVVTFAQEEILPESPGVEVSVKVTAPSLRTIEGLFGIEMLDDILILATPGPRQSKIETEYEKAVMEGTASDDFVPVDKETLAKEGDPSPEPPPPDPLPGPAVEASKPKNDAEPESVDHGCDIENCYLAPESRKVEDCPHFEHPFCTRPEGPDYSHQGEEAGGK